jgi:DNA-binding LacI/PurR family transcriptional regulator
MLIFAINSDIYWEDDRPAAEKYVFDLIPYKDVDCVVIMDEKIKSHRVANKIIDKAHHHKVPVVVADGHYDNVSCVNFNYERGFEQVVRHVIEHHKVKNPHMVAGQPNNEFSNRRIEVFRKVLAENNMPFDDSMLSYGYFWANPCHEVVHNLLKRDTLPDAIICANDIMAITISDLLLDAGYKIPEDTIITGFDGYNEIYFTSPKITSASCDIVYMAEAVADTILLTVKDKKTHNVTIDPVFVSNESCGCPTYSEHRQALRDLFNESFIRHNDDNRILQLVASSMQSSINIEELVSCIDCYKTEHLLCAVDRKCLDANVNYFTTAADSSTEKELVVIYDAENKDKYS